MVREPIFHPTPLADLRPTQITVDMREAKAKQAHWKQKHGDKAGAFLASHMMVLRACRPRNLIWRILCRLKAFAGSRRVPTACRHFLPPFMLAATVIC
jgi:ParB-like nuclease family protein